MGEGREACGIGRRLEGSRKYRAWQEGAWGQAQPGGWYVRAKCVGKLINSCCMEESSHPSFQTNALVRSDSCTVIMRETQSPLECREYSQSASRPGLRH